MKLSTFLVSAMAAVILVSSGCDSKVRRRDASEKPVTTYGINSQDWNEAAAGLASKMLLNLPAPPQGKRWLIEYKGISNQTDKTNLPIHLLKNKVFNALSNAQMASLIDFNSDAYQDAVYKHKMDPRRYPAPPAPGDADFILKGSVTGQRDRMGRNIEATYTFQLELTSTSVGGAVEWQDEVELSKQGTKKILGL
ncbi:MAG: penicillin-binding protein activator LpoB [Phycisphaerales bacterium]|nr:penicillin-binding protein activator LpoB [Phycisphaerales bacterium]